MREWLQRVVQRQAKRRAAQGRDLRDTREGQSVDRQLTLGGQPRATASPAWLSTIGPEALCCFQSSIYGINILAFFLLLVLRTKCPHLSPTSAYQPSLKKQHAVWLGWATYENKRGWSSKSVQLELIRHMVSHVVVKIAVQNDVEQQSVERLIREEGIPPDDVKFYRIPHPDLWFRDTGADLSSRQR